MDDLKKVAQQFAAAANVTAPTSSIPELSNYFKAAFMEPIVKQGIAGPGALASQKGQEADQQDEAARQAKMDSLKRQADPGNSTRQRKTDGGFAFFDPSGKEIDINTFSQRTGKSRSEILSDSENPVDLAYIDDFKRMREAMQVMYGGDEQEKAAFLESNPELRGRRVQDFATDLLNKYPHIYGRGGNGAQAYQKTLGNQGRQIFRTPSYGATGGGTGGGWSPS